MGTDVTCVSITFLSSDIKTSYKSRNHTTYKIGFPKSSKYYGCLWYCTDEYVIYGGMDENSISFNPAKHWLKVPSNTVFKCELKERDSDGCWVVKNIIDISADELSKEMKRRNYYKRKGGML